MKRTGSLHSSPPPATPASGRRSGWCAVLLGCWIGLAQALAADWGAAFEEANLLYEQDRPRQAAEAYLRLATNGVSSVALHFNLGNAWFKAGELGRAILHYRLAHKLDPRDPDVAANLALARHNVAGPTAPRQPWLKRLTGWLRLDEWTLLAGLAFYNWLLLLATARLRPDWAPRLRQPARLAGWFTAGFASALLLAWTQSPALEAIVLAEETPLRHGPIEESPEVQQLPAGRELRVVDRKGQWVQVDGAARGVGWLLEDQVALLPR